MKTEDGQYNIKYVGMGRNSSRANFSRQRNWFSFKQAIVCLSRTTRENVIDWRQTKNIVKLIKIL